LEPLTRLNRQWGGLKCEKGVGSKNLRLEPYSFRPKSARQRGKSMGGASRRPANSGIGAGDANYFELLLNQILISRQVFANICENCY